MQKADEDKEEVEELKSTFGIMGDVSYERFLVAYVRDHRYPLSVVSAILSDIDAEIKMHDEAERYLSEPRARFQSLLFKLMDELLSLR